MLDDSIRWFCRYDLQNKRPGDYLKFGLVFEEIEKSLKAAKGEDHPIVAMSPRRFNGKLRLSKEFVCKPPQCAVYLNINALSLKGVHYRPELRLFEDMMFGYECEKRELKVFMCNTIHLMDAQWKDTGARSPSVLKQSMDQ